MRIAARVSRSATIAIAVAVGIAAVTEGAEAQRRNPVVAQAARPHVAPSLSSPYPGATVMVDPRHPGAMGMIDPRRYPRQSYPQTRYAHAPQHASRPPVVYYIPVPVQVGYGYASEPSRFGGVTDVNGRPLYVGESAVEPVGYGLGTPSLTGVPFVVGEGSVMVVDFGNGDRRPIPSCALLASAQDPDGRPRTIFYQPAADGLVLRAGQTGRVLGAPPAGAATCYAADAYGRVVLDY